MRTHAPRESHDSHPASFQRRRQSSHPKDLLRLADLTSDSLRRVRRLIDEFRAEPEQRAQVLDGQTVLCWFASPTSPVVGTIARAVSRLGGAMVLVNPTDLAPSRVGTVENAARVLSRLGQLIVVGGLSDRDVVRIGLAADVPVLNAFSDGHDPCQALTDLVTVEQAVGPLKQVRLAYVGRVCNVTYDLIYGAALAGMTMMLALSEGALLSPAATSQARDEADRHGGGLHVTRRAEDAIRDAQAVVVGPRRGDGRLEEAGQDAVMLGCQPKCSPDAHLHAGNTALTFQQHANQLLVYQAVIYALSEGLLAGAPDVMTI
jgi:ornithine carbamoyltransferase